MSITGKLTSRYRFGGFEYGYQQGVLGQSLVMTRFTENFPTVVASSTATGWLTSVLQLGGIAGSLAAGILGEGDGARGGGIMEVKTDQMPQDPYHTVRYF